MIAAAAARVAATPRGRAAVLAVAALASVLLAVAPGELAPAAARAGVAAAAVAAGALLLRRRAPRAAPPLAVLARAPLGGGAGVAIVDAGERRLLVGFGRNGVHLVAELGPTSDGARQ